jgi:hypothetical protein
MDVAKLSGEYARSGVGSEDSFVGVIVVDPYYSRLKTEALG